MTVKPGGRAGLPQTLAAGAVLGEASRRRVMPHPGVTRHQAHGVPLGGRPPRQLRVRRGFRAVVGEGEQEGHDEQEGGGAQKPYP